MLRPTPIIQQIYFPRGLALTTSSLLKTIRNCSVILSAVLLSACASTPAVSTAGSVSFGAYPDNYKEIVTDYLSKKPTRQPLDLGQIEFLNEPNKFIFSQINREKFGYRVCSLIKTQDARDLRSHFFLINDGKVTQHLHDSGLVPLSDKFCNVQMLALENRVATPVEAKVDEHGFKYIVCHADGQEKFFALNPEAHTLLEQHDAQTVATYDVDEISDTFIVATGNDARLSVNRVSGTMLVQSQGMESQSSCDLTSKHRF